MTSWLYRWVLRRLIRRKIRANASRYPDMSREDLILWCDFMTIEFVTREPYLDRYDNITSHTLGIAKMLEEDARE